MSEHREGMVLIPFNEDEHAAADEVILELRAHVAKGPGRTRRAHKLGERQFGVLMHRLYKVCEGPALRYLTGELGKAPDARQLSQFAFMVSGKLAESQLPNFRVVAFNPEDN